MGGESNAGQMGFKHGILMWTVYQISRVGITSMPLHTKPDPFFSSADWDPVVNGGGGFSSSHYPSMAMADPWMSCFSHYQPGSGSGYATNLPASLLPFGDCGGAQIDKKLVIVGRFIRAAESHEDHHQVSDGVLGAT